MKIQLFLVLLKLIRIAGRQTITSCTGAPIGDQSNSLSSGPRGHIILQDMILRDELASFNSLFSTEKEYQKEWFTAKVLEHLDILKVTDDITRYSKAKVFSKRGKRTPIVARFSYNTVGRGGAETSRDLLGFAVKFYTEEGNWDLLSNNFPVFTVRDAMRLPSFIHGSLRNPVTNIQERGNRFWDMLAFKPEAMHIIMLVNSDRGITDGFRHMNGYGTNTFKLINEKREAVYCKFHFKTDQGIKNIPVDIARKLRGTEPDYSTRDLYDAIKAGNYPTWTLYIQVMTFQQAEAWYFNPFDATKVWPHKEFPLIKVGKLVLNRLPRNFFADMEQVAFCPANLVPGIEPSPDKNLQGRLIAYAETQRHRLGANFKRFPINYPFKSPPRNYRRDGPQTVTGNQGGEVNYYPNSYDGPIEDPTYTESCFRISGDVCRWNSTDDDNFTQPRIFYRKVLKEDERGRLINNILGTLSTTEEPIQQRNLRNFYQVDVELGFRIQIALRQVKEKNNQGRQKVDPHTLPPLEEKIRYYNI